ncbi:nucleotide-binding universal stress UspA family protein/hemerythrin-like domain-containing protein [Paraburkholderia sp. GAS448]|uniref:universal stress protein n=1 Tax=Paraburkholderia sp. GAS448 TaxID=3035136 RepID=UPI003D2020A3
MYRHFLVPVDGTDACIEAIGQAVEFARSIGARITFLAVPREDTALHRSENADPQAPRHPMSDAGKREDRNWELLARAEAAARAQGVPCSSSAAGDEASLQPIVAAAREHGCDLICMAPRKQPVDPVEPGARERDVFDGVEAAILICPIDRRPTPSRAMGILLDEHRAIADELHAWLSMLRTAQTRGISPEQAPMREAICRLRDLQAHRRRPKKDEWLYPRLRERTSAVDAELDELDQQRQCHEQLLDEVAGMIEREMEAGSSTGRIEQAVKAYAQFTWEHMGREEGVVLPAARRHLRDEDWLEIAAAFDAMLMEPVKAHGKTSGPRGSDA